jgi:hypothetical protein
MTRSFDKKYLVRCECGRNTSKLFARANGGKCKACVHPAHVNERENNERENALLLDSGYAAYSAERGDYDLPDCA